MTTSTSDLTSSSNSHFSRSANENSRLKVKLSGPGQLIAGLPHLLGFQPANSLVVIGHSGESGSRISMVQRVDLPPSEHEQPVVNHLVGNLSNHQATAATVVIIGSLTGSLGKSQTEFPHRRLIKRVLSATKKAHLLAVHAFWTPELRRDAPWYCYQDPDCAGVLPDPSSTVMAAASAANGVVTFSNRAAMERLFDGEDADVLARRSRLLNLIEEEEDDLKKLEAQSFVEIRDALRRMKDFPLPQENSRDRDYGRDPIFTDERLVRLALALEEPLVRDTCLALATPLVTQVFSPKQAKELNEAAEKLWWLLLRALPAPERAEPAALLGYSAYQRGEGTLAGMAFETALNANPEHVLAGLLAQALCHGIAPTTLAGIARVDNLEKLCDISKNRVS